MNHDHGNDLMPATRRATESRRVAASPPQPPCDPDRSFISTSARWAANAAAHRFAFSRKKGSCLPATRSEPGCAVA